jgi:hypothetical protein
MSQQSGAQARILDPVLTEYARGYGQMDFVGSALFPRVLVDSYGGRIVTFGQEHFVATEARRARGEDARRVQAGYSGEPYSITPRGLDASTPFETQRDAQAVPGIDALRNSVRVVMDQLSLGLEIMQADLARAPGSYPASNRTALAGQARWTGSSANPTADIAAAKEAIRRSCGKYPNTILLSATAMSAVDRVAEIRDRLKYTSSDSVTPDMLARLWQVERVVVGAAVRLNSAGQMVDVWGDDVVVAYVSPQTGAVESRDRALPSYGYTYTVRGMPAVGEVYADKKSRSWLQPVDDDCVPVISGIAAGYLIGSAGAAP